MVVTMVTTMRHLLVITMTVSSGLITILDISLEGLDSLDMDPIWLPLDLGKGKDPLIMRLDPPWLPLVVDMDMGKDQYLLKYIHMGMGMDMDLRKGVHKDHMHMHKFNHRRKHGQEAPVPITIPTPT